MIIAGDDFLPLWTSRQSNSARLFIIHRLDVGQTRLRIGVVGVFGVFALVDAVLGNEPNRNPSQGDPTQGFAEITTFRDFTGYEKLHQRLTSSRLSRCRVLFTEVAVHFPPPLV